MDAACGSGVFGRVLLIEDFREPDFLELVKGMPNRLCSFLRVADGAFGEGGRDKFSLGYCVISGVVVRRPVVRRALGVGGMMVVFVAVVVVESGRDGMGLLGLFSVCLEALDWREWEPVWGKSWPSSGNPESWWSRDKSGSVRERECERVRKR